jgi:hypothetical protein
MLLLLVLRLLLLQAGCKHRAGAPPTAAHRPVLLAGCPLGSPPRGRLLDICAELGHSCARLETAAPAPGAKRARSELGRPQARLYSAISLAARSGFVPSLQGWQGGHRGLTAPPKKAADISRVFGGRDWALLLADASSQSHPVPKPAFSQAGGGLPARAL